MVRMSPAKTRPRDTTETIKTISRAVPAAKARSRGQGCDGDSVYAVGIAVGGI